MPPHVAAFTDTYLPTVNGVTYTIQAWREHWAERDGRMDVIYPDGDHERGTGEYPVRSVSFPFYDGYRIGTPTIPDDVRDADVVHAHTPFGVGLAGLRLARRTDRPLVASYHTPAAEYAGYLAEGWLMNGVARAGNAYERWFLDRADRVIAPSDTAKATLEARGIGSVSVVANGIDIDRFSPTDTTAFRERYDLPEERPLVGYTGRHGFEKQLSDLVAAVDGTDITLVFGGDGPARKTLEADAADRDVDARFLGFLDRDELPAFYSALDVFGFPSPIETQGLVALEAMACGTPVVGVEAGALAETIDDGATGYHYDRGDIVGFHAALDRALGERDRLAQTCLLRRESMGVERAVDALAAVYDAVE
jgi:glycosyltransferase involved in cell wall biosynthesis